MNLYIEMEDVLCDVSTPMSDILGVPVKFDNSGLLLKCSTSEIEEELAAQPISFWENLDTTPEFNDIRAALLAAGINIHVITANYSEASGAGKQLWLDKNFPESKLLLSRSKNAFANRLTLLIDCHPGELQNFKRHGGNTILIPKPWQKNYKPQPDLQKFVADPIAAVRALV